MAISREPTIHASERLAHQFIEDLKYRVDNRDDFLPISTGLTDLDQILGGGLMFGQYVIWGGKQKVGKSTVMLNVAKSLLEQKIMTCWFGKEMTNMHMARLLFANVARMNRLKFKQLNVTEEDWESLYVAQKTIGKFPGYWVYGFNTVNDIVVALEKIEKDDGVQFEAICVDYLQLMEANKPSGNRVNDLESISRQLKALSIDWKRPLIVNVAAQLNRASIRAGLMDSQSFHGAGAIERDMDIGIIVTDTVDEFSGNVRETIKAITVVDSRDSGTGTTEIFFDGATAFVGNMIELETTNSASIRTR